ncbi:MAG: type II toxin-antitoxin system VapC family toxin [Armatimonadota bacterium]|nr:type II toxin-antitoxin system VapC family toxin [Armatimonadota bacterium]
MAVYFLDSSATVKRHINEAGSAWVMSLVDPTAGHRIHLTRITGVEVVSAITRRERSGSIAAIDAAAMLTDFRYDFANQYRITEITPSLISRAMTLAETYALRGYDAVQLAAALAVNAEGQAAGLPVLTLVSADLELNTAALAEGLLV